MDENFYNALQGLQQFQEQTSEAREEAIEKSTEKFNTIKEKALDATEPVSTFAEGIMAHTIASKLGLSKEAAEALAKGDIKAAAKQMGKDAMEKVNDTVEQAKATVNDTIDEATRAAESAAQDAAATGQNALTGAAADAASAANSASAAASSALGDAAATGQNLLTDAASAANSASTAASDALTGAAADAASAANSASAAASSALGDVSSAAQGAARGFLSSSSNTANLFESLTQQTELGTDPEAVASSLVSKFNPSNVINGLRGDSTIARALGQSSRTAEELAETSEQTLADISAPVQQAATGVVDSLAAGTQNLLTQGASLLNKVADIGKPAADLAGDVGKSVAADLGEELPVEGGLDLLGPAGWLVGAGLALAPIFVNLFDKPHHKALPKLPIENIAVQSGIVG
jgi:hypothetical protein